MPALWQTWSTNGEKILMNQQCYKIPNVLPFTLTGVIPYEYTKNGRTGKLHIHDEETKTGIYSGKTGLCPFLLGQAVRNRTQSST